MLMQRIATACVLGCGLVLGAHAADFPDRPIHLVVPFPPGGVADTVARTISQEVAREIGQPVLIDNKPGASGIIGAEFVARAKPDGHTLLLANLPVMSINEIQFPNLPYSASRDFLPVIMLTDQPYIIATRLGLAGDMAQFLELARRAPEKLTFGSASSSTHLASELFNARAHTTMTHIPYKGSAPAINDLLGGHIDLLLDTVIGLAPHVKAGKIQALAVTAPTRIDTAPDIPTYEEVGLVDLNITSWQGIVAPAGTPADVIAALNTMFNHALKSPAVTARMQAQGVTVQGGSAAQFATLIAREKQRWSQLAQEIGFKPAQR